MGSQHFAACIAKFRGPRIPTTFNHSPYFSKIHFKLFSTYVQILPAAELCSTTRLTDGLLRLIQIINGFRGSPYSPAGDCHALEVVWVVTHRCVGAIKYNNPLKKA